MHQRAVGYNGLCKNTKSRSSGRRYIRFLLFFFCKEDLRFMQNDIFKYRGITIEVPDTRAIVDGEFVVRVRKKLGMGQKPFARILGITERTLNRWEHEKIFIGNSSSRLLYLLDKNPDLIFELYNIVED